VRAAANRKCIIMFFKPTEGGPTGRLFLVGEHTKLHLGGAKREMHTLCTYYHRLFPTITRRTTWMACIWPC